VQVVVLVVNPDGINSSSSFHVHIAASWYIVEPTKFLANGGAAVTVHGACMPTDLITLVFSGSLHR